MGEEGVPVIPVVGFHWTSLQHWRASFWMISLDIFDLDLGKLGTHATVFGGLPRKDQCFRPSQKTGGFNHRHQPRRDLAARAPRFFLWGDTWATGGAEAFARSQGQSATCFAVDVLEM